MRTTLNMNKIARRLGAERKAKVSPTGGYFGALQLLEEVRTRFHPPRGGGRPTDSSWTERRLLPLAPKTLRRLQELAAKVEKSGKVHVEPMQLAALILEVSTDRLTQHEAEELVSSPPPALATGVGAKGAGTWRSSNEAVRKRGGR